MAASIRWSQTSESEKSVRVTGRAILQPTDMMENPNRRTLVIGFDALDFRYLDAFTDSLPNFSALRSRGVEAPLTSTFPPWTGSAWPSMYTGTDPSHHGVYDFFRFSDGPENASLVSRKDVDTPAIWEYLATEGLSSIVLNVPVTHQSGDVDGVLVPGYLAPEDSPGTPVGIRDELSDVLGEEYRIYARTEMEDDDAAKLEGYLDLIDHRKRAAQHLLSSRDWTFALVQVQKTDAAFHNFDDETAFRRVYEAADDFLGSILDCVGDDVTVIVCSDHGIGPHRGYTIYVNEILREHGYVETGEGGTGPQLAQVKPVLTNEGGTGGEATSVAAQATASLARFIDEHVVSLSEMYTVAERLGLADRIQGLATKEMLWAASDGVDWEKSMAYCRSKTRLGIKINVAGRDPHGVVPEAEYERVRDEIIDLFSELETPDGRPAFDFVTRSEEVYDGPHTKDADDILLKPRAMDNTISTELLGRRFIERNGYDHKMAGTFIAAGPTFDGKAPAELSLTDVAPIVLATLGQPVPRRMTGAVPSGLLGEPVVRESYEDITTDRCDQPSEKGEPDVEIYDRLDDLGYL